MPSALELGAVGGRKRRAEQRRRVLRVTRELRDPDAAMKGSSFTDDVVRFGEDEEEADRDDEGVIARGQRGEHHEE